MQNLRKIRYIAENFDDLLGLRTALAGLILLAAVPAVIGFSNLGVIILSATAFVVLITLWPLIANYYRRNFGRVRSTPGNSRRRLLVSVSAATIYVIFALLDIFLHPMVVLTCFGMALVLVLSWWMERPFGAYYLIAAVLIFGLALLPLVGVLPDVRTLQWNAAMVLIVTGVFLVFKGFLDHQFLIHSMGSLPEETSD